MGMMDVVMHPEEVPALVRMRCAADRAARYTHADPHMDFCYDVLIRVSRSFAVVIQQLCQELRDAVCIFYVVLRALDTVEDDMTIAVDTKLPILKNFHNCLKDPSFRFICGEKHYRELMENFHHVSLAFLNLPEGYQLVIAKITKQMGAGMAKFIEKEVESIGDYDEYCHFVAGLVGEGLSGLFHYAKLEKEASVALSNSMGLFLQKVNIIRDYLEDINELPAPRMFWPREIWGNYASKLSDFKKGEKGKEAVACLNHMITDCLRHAPDCLQYLSNLKDPSVFRFCAIPQIMAVATIALCYNNPEVFKGVVKIRRGITAKILVDTESMSDVYSAFYDFSSVISAKINKNDPSATATTDRVEAILRRCRASGLLSKRKTFTVEGGKPINGYFLMMAMVVFVMGMMMFLLWNP